MGGVLDFIVSLRSNKIGMISKIKLFFKEARQEIKQVNWPTLKETRYLTFVVIGLSLFIALVLGILDYIFLYLLQIFIL